MAKHFSHKSLDFGSTRYELFQTFSTRVRFESSLRSIIIQLVTTRARLVPKIFQVDLIYDFSGFINWKITHCDPISHFILRGFETILTF